MIVFPLIIALYSIGFLNCFLSLYSILYVHGFFDTEPSKDIDVISNILYILSLSCFWFFVTLEEED